MREKYGNIIIADIIVIIFGAIIFVIINDIVLIVFIIFYSSFSTLSLSQISLSIRSTLLS